MAAAMIEQVVTYEDGRSESRILGRWNDRHDRHMAEKAAFGLIARRSVRFVVNQPVTRYAGGRKGGAR